MLLEDGAWFAGTAPLPFEPSFGEVVFTTNLSGYQEVFTDPSYLGQAIGTEIVNYATTAALEETLHCRDRDAAFAEMQALYPDVGAVAAD